MDQETLVSNILNAGSRLDLALRSRGYSPVSAPLVALDLDANQWTLLIGLPIDASRRTIYYEIQDAIESLDLALDLEQVMLVKDSDLGLKELRGAAVSEAHGVRKDSPPIEVAGRRFVEARRILSTPQVYESSLLALLRQSLPDEWLLYRDFRPEPAEARVSRALPLVDFAVQNGDRWVLIEAKAYRRPASTQHVVEALGLVTYYKHYIADAAHVVLLLVVMGGASKAARSEAKEFAELQLIEWSPGQDPREILSALYESLT